MQYHAMMAKPPAQGEAMLNPLDASLDFLLSDDRLQGSTLSEGGAHCLSAGALPWPINIADARPPTMAAVPTLLCAARRLSCRGLFFVL